MGIDGLLKFLRPVTQKQHISSFKNQRVGIDVMSWIYKGCYSCNFELSQNVESFKYLYYLLEMIEILGYYNIKPIFVFDGRSFNLKDDTNQKRIKEKSENRAKAEEFLKKGDLEQARKYYSRCIFIDEKIISTTINVMHTKDIQFIVAPYEADSQIAKLKKLGLIDAAISEDSDLLVYGVNTIFKLTQNGDCDYVDPNKWGPRDVDNQFLKQYFAMTYVNRVEAAILAGSDYNPSIKGIGIKRAVKQMYRQTKMSYVINKLKNEKNYADKVPADYAELTEKAKMIFLFATVYNPITEKLQYMNPDLLETHKPKDMSEEDLQKVVGAYYPDYVSMEVYAGKTQAKDLTPRVVQPVNIRELFAINKENMLAHQILNKKRRYEEQKARLERQQKIKNGQIQTPEMKPGSNPKIIATSEKKPEMTEEQKERRKQDRKNRIVKLQDVMNSVVEMCEKEEEEEKKKQQPEPSLQQIQSQLNKLYDFLGKTSTPQKSEDSEDSESSEEEKQEKEQGQKQQQSQKQQSSASMDLAFLNPFAKNLPATATKPAKKPQNHAER